jgi:micrococcal nuclease
MKSRNALKSNNYLLIGLILSAIGLAIFLSQKFGTQVVKTLPSSTGINLSTENTVIRVIDGDSVILSTGEKIRYIGIDTPEIENGECYGTEAAKVNSDLVLGKDVKLVKDTSETDKYGRLLRYVYVGDILINDYLVKNGFAKVMTVPPDTEFEDEFVSSETNAKTNLLGFWGKCFQK